ncbi:glycosyltransferase involved in cell wall biosynthesis [Pontibacter aydingkolensis]|uniref:Glycosyltransferase family 4 protein n=1 Tax=Pontibacter aydingkolensis TaxID=1911536 RepID=A0ABS7CTM2_9BACT|nr:glycosyltransferase family 4 protein [Pontibacter aydingkolensis]MBW7467204.1 glycosyltransferase family 4 protein [Pontibacter aydingkolensis]
MKKLAIITTHPIQYNAPVFKMLTDRAKVDIKVFYTWEQAKENFFDDDFKREISWDIPLLEGYNYSFVANVATKPGLHHFRGIDNPSLVTEINAFNPDAVLIFGWNFKSHLKVIRSFHNRIPVFFRGDSTLLDEKKGFKKYLRRLLLTWIYRHIDNALYVGQKNKEYFLSCGLKPEQLIFAPHAIDNDRFRRSLRNNDYRNNIISRSNLNIVDSDIVFLFAGKLENKKDPILLAKAFKLLNSKRTQLVFVGNGALEERVKNECQGVSNVHFVDFQNQTVMPFVYELADVFVLPSSGPGETWGLAVNEAMACAKAVLVSNKCGCAIDLVKDSSNGFVFEANNLKDLLEKLNYFLLNPEELKLMGSASQDLINNWNFEAVCQSVERLLLK